MKVLRKLSLFVLVLASSWILGGQIVSAQIDMDQVIKIGQNAIYFKDYVLAIQLFNNAVRADSTRAEPYYYRAMAKYQLDDYIGAESDATKSIERNPFIYDAYYLRGISRHSLGKDSLATLDYEVVLQDNPDHKGALHNASALFIAQKDTLNASKTIAHLKRFFPDYAMGYVLDGGLHLELKDTLEAENLFRKSIDLDKSLTGAYLSLAEIEYNRQSYHNAEELITKALNYIPDESRLYVNRALMRYKQNDIRGAMTDYTEAVRLDPSSILAHYNRALLRTQVGELNGALEDFNAVLEADPKNYFAIFNRALVANQVGDPLLAKEDLDKIISRYPTFVPAYAQRASAYEMLGQEINARKDLYQASKMLYDDKVANQAKALQEIQKEIETNLETDSVNLAVRDERDENIRKFRLLVTNSKNKEYTELYEEEFGAENNIRGRVQDRKGAVSPQDFYQLAYYIRTDGQLRFVPKQAYIDALKLPKGGQQIYVVWEYAELNEEQIKKHLNDLEKEELGAFEKGMAHLMVKDYDGSVSEFSDVIESEPEKPAAYFQRGVSRFLAYRLKIRDSRQGKKDLILAKGISEATLQDFRKVLDIIPNYPPALYNIGCVYYSLGRYNDAATYFTQAISNAPDMGIAYFNLGLTHYAMGNKKQADELMSKAGSLGIYEAYSIIKRMK